MDATCAIQDSIHVSSLVRKYVSRILGTYQISESSGDLLYFSLFMIYASIFFSCADSVSFMLPVRYPCRSNVT